MRSRITIIKCIIYCILMSLIVYILSNAFMGYMNFSMDHRIVMAISAGSYMVLCILFSYPIMGAIIAALMLLSSLVFYIANKKAFVFYAKFIYVEAKGCMAWFYEYLFSTMPHVNVLYSNIIMTVFIILCMLALFLIVVIWHNVVAAMIAGIFAIAFMWFFGYEKSFDYIQQFLFVSLVLLGFVQYDLKETLWKLKKGVYSKKSVFVWMLCTLAFAFIIFTFANFLPGEIKPVNFQWLNDNVFSRIYDMGFREAGSMPNRGTNNVFSIGSFGYQEGPFKLGGAVKLSNRLLFKAKVEGNIKTPIYLRGAVRNVYTGISWTRPRSSFKTAENNSEGLNFSGDDSSVKDTENVALTVYPQSFTTVSIFNIWKPYKLESNAGTYYFDEGGDIELPRDKVSGNSYKVSSDVPVIYSDELKTANPIKLKQYNREDDYIRECLQVPDTLPERVKSFTNDVVHGCKSDFEKAYAIQQYLRNNYPYTLDTSSLPEGRDFVDYFLFDEKKGYCTYYASAMAIMSRIAGIPSRYVEGFIIEDEDMGDDGLYKVTAAKAHAWVELYFQGYGWVRFEPTASYDGADYARSYEGVSEVAPYVENNDIIQDVPVTGKNQKDRMQNNPYDNGLEGDYGKQIPIYVYIILALITLLILRILIKLYKAAKDVKKADNLQGGYAASQYFHIFERKLEAGGIARNPDETPNEFGTRIKDLMENYGINMTNMMDAFGKIRFGNGSMDEGERKMFKISLKAADRLIKDRKGIVKYMVIKYIA